MKNTFGQSVCATIFGESHGEAVGVVLDGLAPGIEVSEEIIKRLLSRRRPSSAADTPRRENDNFRIVSGVFNNKTTGSPVCIIIPNENTQSKDYQYGLARPSHADYVRYALSGTLDFSGGGEFSGRLTAPLCVLGGICKQILEENFGVKTLAYLTRVGNASGEDYYDVCGKTNVADAFGYIGGKLGDSGFPSISDGKEMLDEIKKAKNDGDSVGATVECVTTGLKAGIGGALFGGLEGKIASVVYAIPAVKAVEFGYGERFASARGSFVNDAMRFNENKNVIFETNRSGGINGGVSNGANIVFRASFRPAPTISKPQKTIDLVNKENVEATFFGRNDVCVAVRAVPVVESAAAIALLDEILATTNCKLNR